MPKAFVTRQVPGAMYKAMAYPFYETKTNSLHPRNNLFFNTA